jgi:16S rRNA (cytidine1402-2'-O)-methyltransferase
VVGTPIGNLADLSERARAVLAGVDLIAAEDTRHTRGLLSSIGVQRPLTAYHEHNERARAPELLQRLMAGASVALVSDAGTPLISDPGWTLVRGAHAAGIPVTSVPGPSAVVAALSVAGLPTDRFVFEGFLPRRAAARAARLVELCVEPRTLVFFEAVHRIRACLQALVAAFGAERRATLGRELTKHHEQVRAGSLGSLAASLGGEIPLKGEFVLVVAGAEVAPEAAEAERVFALLVPHVGRERAMRLTAEITGFGRNDLYRLTRLQSE